MHVIDYRHETATPAWALRSIDLIYGEACYRFRRATRNRCEAELKAATDAVQRVADVLMAGATPFVTFKRVQRMRVERDARTKIDIGGVVDLMVHMELQKRDPRSSYAKLQLAA